jgi:hypothetical protein
MSENNDNGEEAEKGFNMEALQQEFKSVLDDKLPEGELATKEDMRETAEEVYRQQREAPPEEEEEREAPPEEEEEEEAPPEPPVEEKQVAEAVGMLQEQYPNLTEEQLQSMLDSMEGGGGNGGGEGGSGGGNGGGEAQGSGGNGGGSGNGGGQQPPEQQKGNDRAGTEDDADSGQHDDYEDREDPVETDDEGVPETRNHEEKEGYSAEELEEVLPGDVWEVVREYLDGGEEMGGPEGAEPEGPEDEEQPSVDIEASEGDGSIEEAGERVLKGKGLSKAGGAEAPSGQAEKSYDDSGEASAANHGDNPALANFYGE